MPIEPTPVNIPKIPNRLLVLFAAVLGVSSCSTYQVDTYSGVPANVVAARKLPQPLNVGAFSSAEPGLNQITCRGVGPIKTDRGETYEEYIRQALVDELLLAERYDQASPIQITGRVDELDFSSQSSE